MAAGEDGIEELLGEARHATLPFPFGRWVNPHCSFEITLEGTFEQKIAKQRTIRGQLRKDAKNPWRPWPCLRGMSCVPSKACELRKNPTKSLELQVERRALGRQTDKFRVDGGLLVERTLPLQRWQGTPYSFRSCRFARSHSHDRAAECEELVGIDIEWHHCMSVPLATPTLQMTHS